MTRPFYWKTIMKTTHSLNSVAVILASFLLGTFVFSCKVDVTEKVRRAYLNVAETDFSVGSDGGVLYSLISASGDVGIENETDWVEAAIVDESDGDSDGSLYEGKYLKIIVSPNGSAEVRRAELVLRSRDCDNVSVSIEQEALAEDPTKDPTCNLLTFRINKQDEAKLKKDIVFTLDKENKTLKAKYLSWIEKENPEMLVPTFTYEGAAVLVNGAEIESGKTAIPFSDDFTLVVRAESGACNEYSVSLNCPQINRELAVLHVRPDELIRGKDKYVQTYVELYDKTPESTLQGWWDSAEKGKIEMRGRGNSTWGLPKKPFRLKFTEKFSPVGLDHAKEKSWVIMAQDMDKSLIRNCIAFEYSRILFNATDNYHHEKALNFTPCMKLLNVYFTGYYYYEDTGETKYLDGEYLGVYQMSDQMNRAKGRIEVDKLGAADGDAPDKITGGYIIETDIHEGNHYSPRMGVKMTYKYPEDDNFDPAQYDYITKFIGDAENALYGSNFKDPVNGWRKWFDEKTLADYIILKEFVGDMDGYTATYMYKRRGYDKLFFGPVWDCDKGWDNDKRVPHWNYRPLSSLMIFAGFWLPNNISNDWFQRVWQDETFRAFVAKRWDAKKGELQAATDRILNEIPAKASKAIDANFTVWKFYYQYSQEAKMPAKTYAGEIERIRDLSEKRAILLDREFNK